MKANRAVVVVSAAFVGAGLVIAALIGNDNTTIATSTTTAPTTTIAPPTTTLTPPEQHRRVEELEDCRAALEAMSKADAEARSRMDHALAMADIAASGVGIGPPDPVSNARSAIAAAEALYGGIAKALAPQIAAHEAFIERCTGVASPDAFVSIETSLSSLHAEAAHNRRRCMDSAEHSERIDAEMAADEFARAERYEREYPDNADLAAQGRAFAREWQQAAAMWRAWMHECP